VQGRPNGQTGRHDQKFGSKAEVAPPWAGVTEELMETSKVASRAARSRSGLLPKRRFAGHLRHQQPSVYQAVFLPFSGAPGSGAWEA
jgi:hypothetical protein